MSDLCGSSGNFGRIAIDVGNAGTFAGFTSASYAFTMLDGGTNIGFTQPHVNNPGMDGEAFEKSELTRLGIGGVTGDVNLFVTPDNLDMFLPLALGEAWATSESWPTVAPPPKFDILIHRDALLYPYFNCQINRLVITGQPEQALRMTLSIVGTAKDPVLRSPGLWPAGLDNNASTPYVFQDTKLRISSPAQLVPFTLTRYLNKGFTITFDNKLVPSIFDDDTPCKFTRSGKATCELQIIPPHTADTVSEIMLGAVPPASLAAQIDLTSVTPNMSAQFLFPALQLPEEHPALRPGEMPMPLTGQARTITGGAHGGAGFIAVNDNVG